MKVKKILIIDDDLNFQKELTAFLKKQHYTVFCVDYDKLIAFHEEFEAPDLIVINPFHEEMSIEQSLKKVQNLYKDTPLIVVANQRNYDIIVKTMQYGAIDYIMKPTNARDIQILSHRIASQSSTAIQIKAVSDLYTQLIDEYEKQVKFSIVSASPEMMKVVDSIAIAASQDDLNVFINGEDGVGKESIARGIHSISKRRNAPFINFDCTAVAPLLLDSELYGHSKNTFTGMMEDKTGVLEAAKGGIVYLKEVTELSLPIQEKLVQTINSGRFKKRFSDKSITLDVRFISSSHKDIKKQVEKKLFIKELCELLSQYSIDILPLRERKEDIILLAKHFISMYAEIMQRTAPEIDQDVYTLLLTYPFPGNVTELKNLIRKAMILSEKNADNLYREDFPDLYIDRSPQVTGKDWQTGFQPLEILDETEKLWLINALKFYHNNKTHVAKALHITRQSLNRRIEKHKIEIE